MDHWQAQIVQIRSAIISGIDNNKNKIILILLYQIIIKEIRPAQLPLSQPRLSLDNKLA